jgi:hypothetical protein
MFVEIFALSKIVELIYCHASLADDGSQSPTIQFRMVRNNDLRERLLATKDQVASMLPQNNESGCRQSFHTGLS